MTKPAAYPVLPSASLFPMMSESEHVKANSLRDPITVGIVGKGRFLVGAAAPDRPSKNIFGLYVVAGKVRRAVALTGCGSRRNNVPQAHQLLTHESEGAPVSSPKAEPDPRVRELVPDVVIRSEFGVSAMSIFRWERDPSLDFPRPVIIRGRRYFIRDQIELFKDRLIETNGLATPSGSGLLGALVYFSLDAMGVTEKEGRGGAKIIKVPSLHQLGA